MHIPLKQNGRAANLALAPISCNPAARCKGAARVRLSVLDQSVAVADRSQSKVYKLDASGKQLATWKSCDCNPGTPGWLVRPGCQG